MADLHLERIYIHPIKSARGLSVTEARLEARGLAFDRRFMVVDEAGTFLTQRELPAMARIDAELVPGGLRLRSDGIAPLEVPTPHRGARREVRVWGDTCNAMAAGDAAAAWLTALLDRPVSLVYFPDDARRPVDPDWAAGAEVAFADGFPLLVVGAASIAEISARVASTRPAGAGLPAIDVRRFRPNLVIAGSEPFEEDRWREIEIAGARISIAKPCSRCAIVGVDPDTTERDAEPLATLAAYRKDGGKVLFGQNAVPRGEGVLRVGDAVTVLASE